MNRALVELSSVYRPLFVYVSRAQDTDSRVRKKKRDFWTGAKNCGRWSDGKKVSHWAVCFSCQVRFIEILSIRLVLRRGSPRSTPISLSLALPGFCFSALAQLGILRVIYPRFMRSPRRTRDARHASELRIYRQTPAKRFWNFFSIFVSVQFENSANLRHREESQEKRNKDTYLLTFFLSFFLTYV